MALIKHEAPVDFSAVLTNNSQKQAVILYSADRRPDAAKMKQRWTVGWIAPQVIDCCLYIVISLLCFFLMQPRYSRCCPHFSEWLWVDSGFFSLFTTSSGAITCTLLQSNPGCQICDTKQEVVCCFVGGFFLQLPVYFHNFVISLDVIHCGWLGSKHQLTN